jgi:acetylornithine deacetylase
VIDALLLVDDICELIAAGPDEAAAQLVVADIAERLGLIVEVHDEDLDALRALPNQPGEEVHRDRLVTVTATAVGRDPAAPRLCLNGHVDVVPSGQQPWSSAPFEPRIDAGCIYGRGTADMRAGVIGALHAAAAVVTAHGAPPGDVVVQSVVAEEDGGLGTFAALRRDAAFAGCVIAEPTDDTIVCANGGALTWRMTVVGLAAHASNRLEGVSALDRFLPIYRALQDLEVALNTDVTLPLMRDLALPYPLSVGVIRAGDWASTVPDELACDGRVGVPLGMTSSEVRRRFEAVVAEAADDRGAAPRIEWSGGQFEPAETPTDDRLVAQLVAEAAAVTGESPRLIGAPYGSDLRHFRSHGIPAVLYGPGELAQAHATDERVEIASVLTHARVLAGLAASFGKPAFT